MAIPRGTKCLNECGPRIRAKRTALGWSQVQLAAKCEIAGLRFSRDTINRIEARARWVGDSELYTIADVLGVTANDLRTSRPT